MEEKSFHYLVLFTGLFLCLLHSDGVSSSCDNINQIDFAEITYEPEGLAPHPDGTVASIECGVHYQILPTAFERTTCTDGSWTGPLPQCRHVRPCIVPPYPRDGWWQNANEYPRGTSVPHNTRLQLRCNWRFDKRRSSVKCNDGVWSDSDDVHRLCRGTPCEVSGSIDVALNITYDPPVSDEDRLNHRIQHDTRVHYDCAWGYRLQGVTETRCEQGRYNNNIPRCELVPCGHPVRATHSTIEILPGVQGYVHGTRVRYSCSEGWEIEGIAERECVNGQWTGSTPACRIAAPPRCMLPDRSSGQRYSIRGFIGNIFDEGLPIGERVSISVSCNQGYRAQPSVQTECLERAVWSVAVPICVRTCSKPGYISHVVQYVNGQETNRLDTYPHDELPEGTFLVSRCSLPGRFVLHGSAKRTCSESSWTGVQPRCVIVETGIRFPGYQPVDFRSNGTVVINPRSQLYMSCHVPSYKVARFESEYGPDAYYEGRGYSTMIMNLYPPHTSQSWRFTCRSQDYTLSHTVYVQFADRMERLCTKPGYISHVVQYVNGLETNKLATYPHDELIPEGTFLVSRCSLPGQYVLHGSANRTCSESSWTGEEPRCVEVDARILFRNNQLIDVRSNGTIVIHPRSQLYISCHLPSYKVARFESENGPDAYYMGDGRLSILGMSLNPPRTSQSGWFTCRSNDNTLSHTVNVQFAEIYCDRPTAPTNGEFQDFEEGWGYERYYMGKEITFACNDGYILDGERAMTCVLGEWSHPTPTCQRHRTTCEELHPPTHGTKVGGNRINDSVLIGCNQGYQLQGEPFLDCQESGNWSHPLPSCVEIVESERPCDSVSCEVWQKCETDSSGVGICRCISHHSCPVTDEPVVCGTDGRNYTNLCRLMALACIRNTGVEVASSNWFCINGVPERALLTPTPFIEIEEPSQLSSFESTYEESPPSIPEPAVREPITLPPNEGPVLEPDTPSFCDAGVCPSSSAAELSQGATAIVIAYADNWDADLGILRIQIYEVMAGGLPSWTEDSYQDVLIDVGAASERGCLCPSFQAADPVIIRFSQNLRQDGKGQLLHTDIVLPYSRDLYHEIRLLLEDYKPCGEAGNVVVAGDNHQANEKAWPWLSVIHRNSSTGWKMMCSGTLLCQQWVLTTSSCFANIDDAEVIGEMLVTIDLEDSQFIPEEIKVTVTLGEYNRSLGEGCEQTIQVDRIVLHDQFDHGNIHDYDIALLHLSEPVELNSCARTICLPSETDSPHEPIVVGWGTASGLPENARDVPLQFTMPLADQAECREDHARDGFDVTDRMLCAGEGSGTDVRCHGDSGSPLMYQRSGDDKWALLGISTKGKLCSRLSRHGIFTGIEPGFKTWINGVTDDCFNNHIPTATILNA